MKELTPEQQTKLNQGCWYEVMKFICSFLIILVFLYGVPMLGTNLALIIMMIFNIIGMAVVARWIANMIYPNNPLLELKNELHEEK